MRAKSRIDDDWEESDPNYRIKRDHGRVMIDRFVKLIDRGYRVNLRYVHEGLGIPLKHPNKKMPPLELWDDGLVNDQWPSNFLGRDNERTIFEPEDTQGFDRFVARVPMPNWIERMRSSTVEDAFYTLLIWSLLLGFIFASSNIVENAWQWLERGFST